MVKLVMFLVARSYGHPTTDYVSVNIATVDEDVDPVKMDINYNSKSRVRLNNLRGNWRPLLMNAIKDCNFNVCGFSKMYIILEAYNVPEKLVKCIELFKYASGRSFISNKEAYSLYEYSADKVMDMCIYKLITKKLKA